MTGNDDRITEMHQYAAALMAHFIHRDTSGVHEILSIVDQPTTAGELALALCSLTEAAIITIAQVNNLQFTSEQLAQLFSDITVKAAEMRGR